MKCKNHYCKGSSFCAVIEPDNNRVIGLKCLNCGARYLIEEIEIIDELLFERTNAWNSVFWGLRFHD